MSRLARPPSGRAGRRVRLGHLPEEWVDGPRIRFGAAVPTALLVGYGAAEWIFVATPPEALLRE